MEKNIRTNSNIISNMKFLNYNVSDHGMLWLIAGESFVQCAHYCKALKGYIIAGSIWYSTPNLNYKCMTAVVGWSHHVTSWTTLLMVGVRILDLVRIAGPSTAQIRNLGNSRPKFRILPPNLNNNLCAWIFCTYAPRKHILWCINQLYIYTIE